MPSKTRKNNKKHNKTSKKVSKRVLEMWKSPESVWGKNKPLEKFWQGLANGDNVVVIYKNGKHKNVKLPNKDAKKRTDLFNEFDADEKVEAVLSSNSSQDSYEIYLYPKAKDRKVDYVIKNYKKYFKSLNAPPLKDGDTRPLMKKVKVPS